VLHGYGANWTANTPSPAISIVGAYTPINTVFVDCNLNSDGFTAEYFWNGGTHSINYINDCDSTYGYGYGDGINISFAPSSYFGWGADQRLGIRRTVLPATRRPSAASKPAVRPHRTHRRSPAQAL